MAKNHESVLWVVWKYRLSTGQTYGCHVFRTRTAARAYVAHQTARWPTRYELGITKASWGPDNIKGKAK